MQFWQGLRRDYPGALWGMIVLAGLIIGLSVRLHYESTKRDMAETKLVSVQREHNRLKRLSLIAADSNTPTARRIAAYEEIWRISKQY